MPHSFDPACAMLFSLLMRKLLSRHAFLSDTLVRRRRGVHRSRFFPRHPLFVRRVQRRLIGYFRLEPWRNGRHFFHSARRRRTAFAGGRSPFGSVWREKDFLCRLPGVSSRPLSQQPGHGPLAALHLLWTYSRRWVYFRRHGTSHISDLRVVFIQSRLRDRGCLRRHRSRHHAARSLKRMADLSIRLGARLGILRCDRTGRTLAARLAFLPAWPSQLSSASSR